MKRGTAIVGIALLAAACAARAAEADVQDLLPADALLAVCYYGDSTDLKQTALYKLVHEPEVKQWRTSLRQALGVANQFAAAAMKVNPAQLKPLVGCQVGLAILPAAPPGPPPGQPGAPGMGMGPPVNLLVVAKLGDEGAAARRQASGFLKQLEFALPGGGQKVQAGDVELTRLGMGPTGLVYGLRGDMLLLSTSDAAIQGVLEGRGPRLREVPAFRRAATMGGSPVALALYNHAATMERFGALLPPQGQAVMAELGLNEVRAAGFRLGARGKALVSTLFVQSAGERRGLLKVVAAEPVDRDLAKLVPHDAGIASVANLDPAALYDTVLAVLQVVAQAQGVNARKALGKFEAGAGVRLRDDLFAALGRGTVVTTSADSVLLPALIVSQATRDPAKVEQALGALVRQLDAAVKAQKPEAGAALKTIAFGEHTVRYLVTPNVPVPLAPCYAIEDGRLVLALSPVHLKDYLLFLDSAEPCLLDNQGFLAMADVLPKDATGFSYADFGGSFMQAYRMVGPLLTMAQGIPRNPVAIDLANMPSPRTIRRHLFGSVSYTYATEDMVVWECHSPTGLQLVGPLPAVAAAGIGAGMVLPAVARARTAARGVVSKNNLKQIGLGVHMYTADHEGRLPPDLDALFDGEMLADDQILIAPNDPAPRAMGQRRSSYVYLLGDQPDLKLTMGDINRPAAVPLAWERQSFGGGVRNVVFCDGHVQEMAEADFQRRLARVRNWLREKAGERKGEF
ncbi:MAG: DUF1559 domain-containing protein [Planctomycetota bacterium]